MKFSFIIPSINQFDMLFGQCINSLVAHNGSDHEIIVVEDGSTQHLQTKIAEECEKRGVKLIINQSNLGFPKTVNKGLRAATGDLLILVNNDVVFTQNVTQAFKKAFEFDDRVGIVGSLLFYPNGTIQHGGILAVGPGAFTHRGWHKTLETAPDVVRTDYLIGVTGALFGIRREAMNDIGLMNEEYFLSCDDTEYCLRAWQKDWKVLYSHTIRAIHAEGATRGNNDRDKLHKSRHWYIQERETIKKFTDNFKATFNWQELEGKVRQANIQLASSSIAPSNGQCEKRYYGEGATVVAPTPPIEIPKGGLIAVRRTGALGDVLLTTGIIKRLKELNPDSNIWVATHCSDVFRDNPDVSNVVPDISAIPNPAQVYDLDLAYESKPKMPVVEAYARKVFGEFDGEYDFRPKLFSTDFDYGSLASKLGSVKLERDRVAVLHMSVGWASRTWARDKWNEVSRRLSGANFRVVVVGRGADFRSDLFNGVLNLVDHLSIHEIKELCTRASVFVGIDSGLMHVALTTECPVVGLFTVANPDFRVANRKSKTLGLVPKTECRFCLHEQRPPVTFVACKFGTNHCLDDFTPVNVVDAAMEIAR